MAKRKKARAAVGLVGEVCLYGAHHCGFAYYATVPRQSALLPGTVFVGNGGWNVTEDSITGSIKSATEAVFLACRDLRAAGVEEGTIRVFAPGGAMYGDISVSSPPTFGSIEWQRAEV